MKGVDKLLGADPMKLALAVVIVGGVSYLILRASVKDVGRAASAAAGAVSGAVGDVWTGDVAWNEGTPYEGAGILGTLGGTVNRGIPILDDIGAWLGGKLYELTHPEWNAKPTTTAPEPDKDERDWWPFW